ncbi:MAG: bifunctional hydroxymethylpyrimidine kinase/phosphomethylpyrimidine kinase, partial [Gammaproteobacteria bacterium]
MILHARQTVPRILVFAGLDPTGGAGLQADIEALSSMGCHSCPVMTANTVQDTHNASRFEPCEPELLREQVHALLADFTPDAVKIGMLAGTRSAHFVNDVLAELPHMPVVLDPVLAAGGGTSLGAADLSKAIHSLLPRLSLITPNQAEAERLTGLAEPDQQAKALCDGGCDHVLITGGDASTEQVINRLYTADGLVNEYSWERLPGHFHGTGCTLAAATTGLLAQGESLEDAVF